MKNSIDNMYWETYDDQDTNDFDFIGVEGSDEMEELTNIEEQVAELQRVYGKRVEIRVYREVECSV